MTTPNGSVSTYVAGAPPLYMPHPVDGKHGIFAANGMESTPVTFSNFTVS